MRRNARTTGLTLTGSELRNTLEGKEGDDRRNGGAGTDRLDGGLWSDVMTDGGSGTSSRPASSVAAGNNIDTVADFVDTLEFDRTYFAGLALGQLAAAQFATAAATGSRPQIVYDQSRDALFHHRSPHLCRIRAFE